MADKALELKKILNTLDPDRLTQEDFAAAFNLVLKFVADMDAENKAAFAELKNFIELAQKSLSDSSNEGRTALNQTASELFTKLQETVATKLKEVDDKLATVRNGIDADSTQIVEDVLTQIKLPEYRAPIMDGPQEIRDKLELLQGDERLDVSAIKGLDERIKEMTPQSNGTNFVISRGAVKMYDLSDQLDGSTKTFALPAFWRVISVHSSSLPHIMRPTIDYTTDGAAMTITFTSEIDASTVLAAGQSIIVVYGEA